MGAARTPARGAPAGAALAIVAVRRRAALAWEHRLLYLLVLPFAALTAAFGVWPIALSVLISFTESHSALSDAPVFVGFANFRVILADRLFLESLALTLAYTLISVALNVGVALGLALLLASESLRRGSTFFKLALFMPVVTPEAATFIVWKWMFSQDFGAVNAALRALGLPDFPGTTTGHGAFIVLVVVELWHHVGFYTLIFLTNLQLLDPSLDEAGRMDGASKLRRIRSIWIPQLRPAIAVNSLYALIQFLKTFTAVLVITKGGPNFATNFVSYYAYTKFDLAQYGEATAMATVLFAVVLLFTLLLHAHHQRRDHR